MTLAWPFRPTMDVIESLEWDTNVIKAKKAEYRLCLRPVPRVGYQCRYVLDDFQYAIARELARTIGGSDCYVPDWPNYTDIPSISAGTASLPVDATYAPAYKVGGFVLIWSDNLTFETVGITAVGSGTVSITPTANSYTNPAVAPMRLGQFTQELSGNRGPHQFVEMSASFECQKAEDLSALGDGTRIPSYTYRGDPLIPDPIEIINSVQEHNIRETEPVDSKTGLLYRYPIFATPNQSAALGWTLQDATAIWNLRVWLHTRRGKWKQFWASSWNADITITRDISVGDSTIEIEAIGFASKYPLPSDFAIVAADGGFWAFRVTGASAGSPGREVLTLGTPFSGSLALSFIDKACKITLSRLDSDRIDIQHLPGRQATVAAATKEVPIYP